MTSLVHFVHLTPKGPLFGGNTSFEPFSVRIGATVRAAWARNHVVMV